MAVKYLSNRVKDFKVGISDYSENKTSLSVIGLSTFKDSVGLGSNLNVTGVSTVGEGIFVPNTKEIKLGGSYASPNFRIYNNGTQTYIKEQAGGNLYVSTNSLNVLNQATSHTLLKATQGSNGYVQLYQNNEVKLETTGLGITVFGNTETQTLNVTGVSTLTGIVTTGGDLYVGGDLYISDDLVLDNITGNSLKITGLSTFEGISTFSSNVFVEATTDTNQLNVSGVSSFRDNVFIGSANLTIDGDTQHSGNINVSGVSTFGDDVIFVGAANTNVTWDKSANTLQFDQAAIAKFGTGLEIFQNSWNTGSGIKNTSGDLEFYSDATHIAMVLRGSDDGVALYHNNFPVLSTRSYQGVNIQRDLTVERNVGIGTTIFTDPVHVGMITSKTYVGILSAYNVYANDLEVNGTSIGQDIVTRNLKVTGISTFGDDIHFVGNAHSAVWDKTENALGFADNARVTFGGTSSANPDLEIYHSGTNSFIDDVGTGSLNLRGSQVNIGNGVALGLRYIAGSVVELFHNNLQKLQTESFGVSITGTTDTDQLNVSGVSTLGVTSATDLEAQQLNVSGVSTFADDVDFVGDPVGSALTSIQFHKGDGSNSDLDVLRFYDSSQISLGVGNTGGLTIQGNYGQGSYILASGNNFFLDGGTSTTIKIRTQFARNAIIANSDNGGSGTVELYHSAGGTATKKLETSGLGVTVYGTVDSTQLNVSGVSTLTGNTFVGSAITMYASSGIVSATKFYGDGAGLENTGASLAEASGTQRLVLTNLTSGTMVSAATTSDVTFNATTDTFHVGSAVTVYGGTTGVVSATSYNGDLVIGTPNGGFKSGAFTINSTDMTKDSINDLNNILGKLVPDPPDTINGVSINLTGTAGNGRLCAGFTPTNNTGGSAPSAGTQYTRNTDSTVSTTYITEYGPGDSGTVTGFVNAVGVGTTTLAEGDNNGTYGAIQIANNEDAFYSTRNTGIASGFYEIYDLRMVNGASPDGYNLAKFTQGSSTTGSVYWYEDPSTVGAPVISFGNVQYPSSPTYSYSSGIPHYTQSTNNNFTYVMTVTNASGDMYTTNTFVNSDGQTGAFQNPGNKSYTNFASGTNPPARNYGVGAGVTTLITQTPRNLHTTVTSNIFTQFDASTPYGSHNNQRVGMTTDFNIMGTTADYTNNVDEDAIECTVGSLSGGSATRVKAGATGDNPTATYVSWTGGSAGSIDTYEATVRGGDLRHDQTDYSDGSYLPVGPDYSASRSGSQYFQFQFIQAAVSQFQISYTGSLAGCWVCMPDNSTWTTSLSGKNGWADMFTAYKGSGVPTSAEPGCSSGGVMDTNGGTFTCVFGTESSSNDSNNRVLIRFKLTSGNSISDISLSDT